MDWKDRIENYEKITGFPKSLFIGGDDRVVGTFIMGNNYKARKDYYGCLHEDAPVLKADLTWCKQSEIKLGDELVGFSEQVENTNQRYFSKSTVKEIGEVFLPGIKITLKSGLSFVCSDSHLWLCKTSYKHTWICAKDIKPGYSIRKILDVWNTPVDSYSAGWLSGILDGEANKDVNSGLRICISQKTGNVQSKIIETLNTLDIEYSVKHRIRDSREINETTINNISEVIKLLGLTSPLRFKNTWIGKGLGKIDCFDEVVEVSAEPVQRFIGMTTSTKTFIAYGLASHNSYPAGYLKRIKAMFPDKTNVLHLFSGKVDTVVFPGKTVDINADNNPDYVDDAQTLLNVPLNTFDLVLADPPYSVEDCYHYQTTMIHRNKVMKALGNGLVSGSHVVWLDQVLPMYKKTQFKIVAVIGMVKSTNHRFRVITIFEKI